MMEDVTLETLIKEVADINRRNGWSDDLPAPGSLDEKTLKIVKAALIHSEVSELVEWVRLPANKNPMSNHIPVFTGEAEELADIVIRVLDYAYLFGINLEAVILAKLEYNRGRGYRHGGKVV